MAKLAIVMGANATGKTYFIEHHFKGKDVDVFNIYDYQQRAYAQYGEYMPFEVQIRCMLEANQNLLHDTIERLQQGRKVVIEQTFFKAKHRIGFLDEVRKVVNVEIAIYIMNPSDEVWTDYINKREMPLKSTMAMKDNIEFPNIAEGFDTIYEVIDDVVQVNTASPTPEILELAREELRNEKERIQKEDQESQKRQEFLESFETRPFLHWCECCNKKEWITAEEAFQKGWNYPPRIGTFGLLLGPRTCGNCSTHGTLFWKSITEKERFPLGIVLKQNLTPEELKVWERIKGEPDNLLKEYQSDDKENQKETT